MASVPFSFDCDKYAGFVTDPTVHKRAGFVTTLNGFKSQAPLRLTQDIQVSAPFNQGATPTFSDLKLTTPKGIIPTAGVVGLIEKFAWNGGVGDPIRITFYVSQWNAVALKTAIQNGVAANLISELGFWISDYDAAAKKWFEQAYPTQKVSGLVANPANPEVNVDMNAVPAKNGIGVTVYKVTLGVAPAANKAYTLQFANSARTPVAKPWGLQTGNWAAGSVT